MKIVVAGGGEVGFMFAQALSRQHDLTIIEPDPNLVEKLGDFDVQVISGNSTDLETLKSAQVGKADIFIASAHSDEVNVISCLAAKQLGEPKTFCFVNKEHYFSTFDGKLGENLTIDRLLWPEKLMAEDIARVLSVPEAIDVEIIERGLLKILEYKIKRGGFCDGKTFKELQLPKGTLAIAIFRDDQLFIPGGATVLLEHDKVMFIGFEASMRKLARRFSPDGHKGKTLVTIIGGGNVGMLLAGILDQLGGFQIQIFEKSLERCQNLSQRLSSNVLIFNEDGSDLEVLENHQFQSMGYLVTLTESDEKNLLISLAARQLGIPKILTRVGRQRNIPLFEAAVPDIMIVSRDQAIQNVVREITSIGMAVETILEKGKAEILKLTIPEGFEPKRVMDVRLPEGVIIATIHRKADTIVPGGQDMIKPHDVLRVFCATGRGDEARAILCTSESKPRGK
jgi:trk system potassium uptake protein TrkA